MVRKNLLIVMAAAGVMLMGCPKHKQPGVPQNPNSSATQKTAAALKSDKAFNKYFTDGHDTAKSLAKSVQTFSMRKPEPVQAKKPEVAPAAQVAPVAEVAPAAAKVAPPVKAIASRKTAPAPIAQAAPVEQRAAALSPAPKTFPKVSASSGAAPALSANGLFVVQVASTPSSDEAELIASKFKKLGYSPYIVEVHNPRADLEGTYYRVRIGGFNTEAEAKTFGETVVKSERLDYWVAHKSNEKHSSLGASRETGSIAHASPAERPATRATISSGLKSSRNKPAVARSPNVTAAGSEPVKTPPTLPLESDPGAKPSSIASSGGSSAGTGSSAAPLAGGTAGQPTFDELMKAIDDNTRKSASAPKQGSSQDSIMGNNK